MSAEVYFPAICASEIVNLDIIFINSIRVRWILRGFAEEKVGPNEIELTIPNPQLD